MLAWIGSAVGMDSGAPKAGGRKGSPAPTYLPLGAPPGRYGYTPLVWTVVMLNAFGGLCVAVVVKYASRACAGRPLAPLRIALPVVRGAGRMRRTAGRRAYADGHYRQMYTFCMGHAADNAVPRPAGRFVWRL